MDNIQGDYTKDINALHDATLVYNKNLNHIHVISDGMPDFTTGDIRYKRALFFSPDT
jgi:hypothetical protein